MATAKPKIGRKAPSKDQRVQAVKRREARRDGLSMAEVSLTPFIECFCHEYIRVGIPVDAHRAAERITKTPLDLSGFHVETFKDSRLVKGKKVWEVTHLILDPNGFEVQENDVREGRALQYLQLPEVKARIEAIRDEMHKAVKVTAETLSEEASLVYRHAVASGQLQVAANVVALKSKLFGLDAGGGADGAGTPVPVTSVQITIKDMSGKAKG